MPLVNFLVEANVDDPSASSLISLAEDIDDALTKVLDVTSVKPWARPSVGLTSDIIQQQAPSIQPPLGSA